MEGVKKIKNTIEEYRNIEKVNINDLVLVIKLNSKKEIK